MSDIFDSLPPEREQRYIENADEASKSAEAQVIKEIADTTLRIAGLDLQQHSIGHEAERFLEADTASEWAKALDDGAPAIPAHRGLTPVVYRMSKAIGDEERAQVQKQYIEDPSSITMPPTIGNN